jgi:hypothetical protein
MGRPSAVVLVEPVPAIVELDSSVWVLYNQSQLALLPVETRTTTQGCLALLKAASPVLEVQWRLGRWQTTARKEAQATIMETESQHAVAG